MTANAMLAGLLMAEHAAGYNACDPEAGLEKEEVLLQHELAGWQAVRDWLREAFGLDRDYRSYWCGIEHDSRKDRLGVRPDGYVHSPSEVAWLRVSDAVLEDLSPEDKAHAIQRIEREYALMQEDD